MLKDDKFRLNEDATIFPLATQTLKRDKEIRKFLDSGRRDLGVVFKSQDGNSFVYLEPQVTRVDNQYYLNGRNIKAIRV